MRGGYDGFSYTQCSERVMKRHPKYGVSKYGFQNMEIGESIYAEGVLEGERLRDAAKSWHKTHAGIRFVTRTENAVSNEVCIGVRVWRVA